MGWVQDLNSEHPNHHESHNDEYRSDRNGADESIHLKSPLN